MEDPADSPGKTGLESDGELTRLDHLQLWAAALLIRTVIELIGATWRIEVVRGAAQLDELLTTKQPSIIGFWHDRLPVLTFFVQRRLLRRGYPVTSFVSRSRDGEIGAKLSRMWGADTIRGSDSSGSTAGLRGLYRAVVKHGSSPVIALDGPKGPRHEAKRGAIALARMCGAPLLPLACSANRFWQLRSWDRMTIPRPFARVHVTVGQTIPVRKDDSSDRQETIRRQLERTLEELQQQADRGAGG